MPIHGYFIIFKPKYLDFFYNRAMFFFPSCKMTAKKILALYFRREFFEKFILRKGLNKDFILLALLEFIVKSLACGGTNEPYLRYFLTQIEINAECRNQPKKFRKNLK